jgi:hypothetical protein
MLTGVASTTATAAAQFALWLVENSSSNNTKTNKKSKAFAQSTSQSKCF